MSSTRNPVTAAVQAGIDTDTAYGAVVPPLVLTSNFSFEGIDGKRKYDYTRSGNPTRDQLVDALSELEQGAGGAVTSTGMSAILLALHALLNQGDTLVVPHDCYGGSWRLFHALANKGMFKLVTLDLTRSEALQEIQTLKPAVVWIETPSNPLLRITDIQAVSECAHQVGAKVVADNTFLSPLWQKPLTLGADVVIHSTTKYINGHSDVVGGAAIGKTPELAETLAWWANALGITGSPFDSYQTMRGLRTLGARLRVHEENAKQIADMLDAHPAVERVFYPGLSDHQGHETAARQQQSFGAMLSFELKGGEAAVRQFVDELQCFTLAESLGGVESLVAHPATMTHAAVTPEARAKAGINDGLLRLSVGIEHVDDLLDDLKRGLACIQTR